MFFDGRDLFLADRAFLVEDNVVQLRLPCFDTGRTWPAGSRVGVCNFPYHEAQCSSRTESLVGRSGDVSISLAVEALLETLATIE